MNTELRNKLFNKIKNVFENEDTQEKRHFFKQGKMLMNNIKVRVNLQRKLLRGLIQQKMFQH